MTTKYGFRTSGSDKHGWFGSVTIKRPHHYGKHTSFGERTVLKVVGFIEIQQRFATRAEARNAARQAAYEKIKEPTQ